MQSAPFPLLSPPLMIPAGPESPRRNAGHSDVNSATNEHETGSAQAPETVNAGALQQRLQAYSHGVIHIVTPGLRERRAVTKISV